jgi:hypothetical protein
MIFNVNITLFMIGDECFTLYQNISNTVLNWKM